MSVPICTFSAEEVVWALLRAGYEIRARAGDAFVLASPWRTVRVPIVDQLVPTELFSVLRQAGISYSDFVEHLVDAPTEPDVEPATHRA